MFRGFEWDRVKAASNELKHGVTFEEAADALLANRTVELSDAVHPSRILTIGFSGQARLLTVVSTEVDGDRIRIISARRASPGERAIYEEE